MMKKAKKTFPLFLFYITFTVVSSAANSRLFIQPANEFDETLLHLIARKCPKLSAQQVDIFLKYKGALSSEPTNTFDQTPTRIALYKFKQAKDDKEKWYFARVLLKLHELFESLNKEDLKTVKRYAFFDLFDDSKDEEDNEESNDWYEIDPDALTPKSDTN